MLHEEGEVERRLIDRPKSPCDVLAIPNEFVACQTCFKNQCLGSAIGPAVATGLAVITFFTLWKLDSDVEIILIEQAEIGLDKPVSAPPIARVTCQQRHVFMDGITRHRIYI